MVVYKKKIVKNLVKNKDNYYKKFNKFKKTKRFFFFFCKKFTYLWSNKYNRLRSLLCFANIYSVRKKKNKVIHLFFYKNFIKVRDVFFLEYLFTLRNTNLFRSNSRFFRVIFARLLLRRFSIIFQTFSTSLCNYNYKFNFINILFNKKISFGNSFRLKKKINKIRKIFLIYNINFKEKRKRLYFYNRSFLFKMRSGLKLDKRFFFKAVFRLRYRRFFKKIFIEKQIFFFKRFWLYNLCIKKIKNKKFLSRFLFFKQYYTNLGINLKKKYYLGIKYFFFFKYYFFRLKILKKKFNLPTNDFKILHNLLIQNFAIRFKTFNLKKQILNIRLKNTYLRNVKLGRFFFKSYSLSKNFLFFKHYFHLESPRNVRFENNFYLWFKNSKLRIFRKIKRSRFNDYLILRLKFVLYLKHWARVRASLQRPLFFKSKLLNIYKRKSFFFKNKLEGKSVFWKEFRFLSLFDQRYLYASLYKKPKRFPIYGFFHNLRLTVFYYNFFFKHLFKSSNKENNKFHNIFLDQNKFILRRVQFSEQKNYSGKKIKAIKNKLIKNSFYKFRRYIYIALLKSNYVAGSYNQIINFDGVFKYFLLLNSTLKKNTRRLFYFFKHFNLKKDKFDKICKLQNVFRSKVGGKQPVKIKKKYLVFKNHLVFKKLNNFFLSSLNNSIFQYNCFQNISLFKFKSNFKKIRNFFKSNSLFFFNIKSHSFTKNKFSIFLEKISFLYFNKFRSLFFIIQNKKQSFVKNFYSLSFNLSKLKSIIYKKFLYHNIYYDFPLYKEIFFNTFYHILRKRSNRIIKLNNKKRKKFYINKSKSFKDFNLLSHGIKKIINFKRTPFRFNYFFNYKNKKKKSKSLVFSINNKLSIFNYLYKFISKFKLVFLLKNVSISKFKIYHIKHLLFKFFNFNSRIFFLSKKLKYLLKSFFFKKKKYKQSKILRNLFFVSFVALIKRFKLYNFFFKRILLKLNLDKPFTNWFLKNKNIFKLEKINKHRFILSKQKASLRYYFFSFFKFYNKFYNFIYPTSFPFFIFLNTNKKFLSNYFYKLFFFSFDIVDNFFRVSNTQSIFLYKKNIFIYNFNSFLFSQINKTFKNNFWIFRSDYFLQRRLRFLLIYGIIFRESSFFSHLKKKIIKNIPFIKYHNKRNIFYNYNKFRSLNYSLINWNLISKFRSFIFYEFILNFFVGQNLDLIYLIRFPNFYSTEKTGLNYELFFKKYNYNLKFLPFIKRVLRTRRFNIRSLLRLPQRSVSIFKRRFFSDFFRFRDLSKMNAIKRSSFLNYVYKNSFYNFKLIIGQVISIVFQKALRHYYIIFDYGMKRSFAMPLVAFYGFNNNNLNVKIDRARYDFVSLMKIKFFRLFNFILKKNSLKFFRNLRYARFYRKRGPWKIWYDYFILSMRVRNTTLRMKPLKNIIKRKVLYKNKKLFDFVYNFCFTSDISLITGSFNVLKLSSLSNIEKGKSWSLFKLSKFFYKRFLYNFNLKKNYIKVYSFTTLSSFLFFFSLKKLNLINILFDKLMVLKKNTYNISIFQNKFYMLIKFFKYFLFIYLYILLIKYFLFNYLKYYLVFNL